MPTVVNPKPCELAFNRAIRRRLREWCERKPEIGNERRPHSCFTRLHECFTKSYRCLRLTLRAAVGLSGLLRYSGIKGRGMRRWLIVAGRSCRMRVGNRRGRRSRRYRLLGLLHGGCRCCCGGAIATPNATRRDATGWLLLLLMLLQRWQLLLLLLRCLLRRRWFLRVRRLVYRFCNKRRFDLEY